MCAHETRTSRAARTAKAVVLSPSEMRLGLMLLRWRAAEGIGIREMATQLGVSASTLSRLENGYSIEGKTLSAILRWMLEDTK